jgi:hypothetical protein
MPKRLSTTPPTLLLNAHISHVFSSVVELPMKKRFNASGDTLEEMTRA